MTLMNDCGATQFYTRHCCLFMTSIFLCSKQEYLKMCPKSLSIEKIKLIYRTNAEVLQISDVLRMNATDRVHCEVSWKK